jgi:ATP-dependent RNA helicase HelY
LADVVSGEEVAGGDFVRTTKQLVDLARQVALVAPDAATRERAREVGELAFRGVVADVVVGGGAVDSLVDE